MAVVRPAVEKVFAFGEATTEANLITASGARVPYFFTGRRVFVDGQPCLAGVGRMQTSRSDTRFGAALSHHPPIHLGRRSRNSSSSPPSTT
jgi:hypothetical protein